MTASLTAVPAVGELLNLTGRPVLVTGASGGIGAGIAVRLAEAGATVIAHANINRDRLDPVLAACSQYSDTAYAVVGDLSREDTVAAVFAEINERSGALQGLVNNAGVQPLSVIISMDPAEFDAVYNANVRAIFLLTQAAANRSIAQSSPLSIVNISSIEGEVPAAMHSHYAASKAAVLMYTRAAALELGDHGIRVNAINPGLIHRDGIENQWPEGVERWTKAAPLTRLGTPTDIADACLFLLSDASRWITAASLRVDGGVTANQPY